MCPFGPVNAKEVQRMRCVGIDRLQRVANLLADRGGIRELRERRQHNAPLAQPLDVPLAHLGIDDGLHSILLIHSLPQALLLSCLGLGADRVDVEQPRRREVGEELRLEIAIPGNVTCDAPPDSRRPAPLIGGNPSVPSATRRRQRATARPTPFRLIRSRILDDPQRQFIDDAQVVGRSGARRAR